MPGQVIYFLHDHRKMPIASPAILEKMGNRFREAVRSFATTNNISTVRCDNGERHIARDLSIELRADGLPIPDGRWHLGHGNR